MLRLLESVIESAHARELQTVLNRDSTHQEIERAFDKAIRRLRSLRAVLSTAPYDPIQAARDLIELLDASSKSTAGTIGQIRQADDDYQLALRNLEGDTRAAHGIKSSQKAVLQKINSATLMQVKEQHKANELLLHLLEQQMLLNQQHREAVASLIDTEAYRRIHEQEAVAIATVRRIEPPQYR